MSSEVGRGALDRDMDPLLFVVAPDAKAESISCIARTVKGRAVAKRHPAIRVEVYQVRVD